MCKGNPTYSDLQFASPVPAPLLSTALAAAGLLASASSCSRFLSKSSRFFRLASAYSRLRFFSQSDSLERTT